MALAARVRPVLEDRSTWITAGLAASFALIVWTRVLGVDQTLWTDEINAINLYIDPGPGEILTNYEAENHVLFSLLAWLTTASFADSEALFRLWSVIPAIAAPIILAWWAWRRWDVPWIALGFAFLMATSPLHLEASKEARGYGLALLFTTLMIITGSRAIERDGGRALAGFAASGVAAVATLPTTALTLLSQVAVLLARPALRRRVMIAGGTLTALVALVYFGLLLWGNAGLPQGGARGWDAIFTGPLQDLVAPDLRLLLPGLGGGLYDWMAGLLVVAGVIGLVRRDAGHLAALLAAPLLVSYLGFAVIASVEPERFQTYLLPHALMLTAAGIVTLAEAVIGAMAGWGDTQRWLGRVAVAAALLAVALPAVPEVLEDADEATVPRENFEETARLIEFSGATVAFTNVTDPDGLRYYLPEDVELVAGSPDVVGRELCSASRPVAYVEQTVENPPVDRGCLRKRGAISVRPPSRDEDREIDVWLLGEVAAPPGRSSP